MTHWRSRLPKGPQGGLHGGWETEYQSTINGGKKIAMIP
jgi:hypothetical protein